MDLSTVASYRRPSGRADLTLAPGEQLLGGGTWLFSEPQPNLTGLVDLTALGWPDLEPLPDGGLRIAATCPIATLAADPSSALFGQCADALLMSFKIQQVATVGGNVCMGLPAGAMISLLAALDAQVVIWTPDGGERRCAVTSFVAGVNRVDLAAGEVVRAFEIDGEQLRAPAAFRKLALTELGRSSAVVIGVATLDGVRVTITASVPRPVVLALGESVESVTEWYEDPHGPADWRRAVTAVLVDEVRAELGS